MKATAILTLLLPSTLLACLWVDGTTIEGRIQQVGGYSVVHRLRHAMSVKPRDLTASAKFGKSVAEAQSNEAEAVDKIYSGDLDAALVLLKKLEEESPGQYSTAANMGTAYELIGDNVNALKWITDGINRNPDSHLGTEWLHALILEAKIDSAEHPKRQWTGRILNVPERMKADTQILVHGKTYSAKDIKAALFYQLNERMVFVKPKDAYVADLLFSYALIEANLGTVEAGLGLLKLAREYGFPDESILSQYERQYRSILTMATIRWWAIVFLAIVGFFIFLVYCHRRKWFFLSRHAYLAHKEAQKTAKTQGNWMR